MKKLLAILLTLVLCLGVFASCDIPWNEPEESSQNDWTNGEVAISNLGYWNYENPSSIENLNYFSAESISPYTAYTDFRYYKDDFEFDTVNENGWCYNVEAIWSYDAFLEGIDNNNLPDSINKETFENNFVVVIKSISGHIRTEDVYYSGFKKENEHYELTYHLVSRGQEFSDAEDPYTDVCLIPKSVCKDGLSDIEIKVIRREYDFDYVSSTFVVSTFD